MLSPPLKCNWSYVHASQEIVWMYSGCQGHVRRCVFHYGRKRLSPHWNKRIAFALYMSTYTQAHIYITLKRCDHIILKWVSSSLIKSDYIFEIKFAHKISVMWDTADMSFYFCFLVSYWPHLMLGLDVNFFFFLHDTA